MSIFLRVTGLFWKYWPRALVTYFCLFAGAAMAIAIPRLTGNAIDQALGTGSMPAVSLTALAIAGAGLLQSFLSYWQSYLSEYLSQRVAYDLRNRMYNRLQTLSYAFHDRSQTGQLMSRATADVEGIRMFVGFALLRGVYFIVLLVTIAVVLFLIDWRLALISLSVLPFIAYRTLSINSKLRNVWMKIQQGIGQLGTIVQENLVGARVVRAFVRQDYENQKFGKQAKAIYDQEITANNLLAINSPLMTFALYLAMAAILGYGGRQVISGSLTAGELTQFLLYAVMLAGPIRMLGWLVTLFSRALSSGQRVFEILDEVSPVTEKPDAINPGNIKGDIRFEHVGFGYGSHGDVLKDVDFTVKSGQIVALVGATGSGKSTIANLIPRFYDVTSGRITIDDIDIRDYALTALRQYIGIVHQDTFLFSASIRENISYGRPEADLEDIVRAAKTVRLHDFIMSLPEGYETQVGERGITLSGGQKQRIAIARTILLNPRIIIMDDSTSSVDTETEYFIQQSLAGLLSGRTTFIVAQRLRSVQMADLILVLKDGEVVERGTHQELIKGNGLYQQFYTLQFQYQEGWNEPVEAEQEEEEPDTEADTAVLPGESHPHPLQLTSSLTKSDEVVFGKAYDSHIISRMLRYFASFKVALPLTIAATFLYTFTIVASPWLIGRTISNYIVAVNLTGLNIMVLLFIGNAALNLVAYYTQIRAEAALGQGILLTLRRQIFSHVQNLSVSFFDRNAVGRIMSRIQNDVGEMGDFLDSGAFWVIGEVVSLVAIAVAMFTMQTKLALITLSVIPLLFLFIFLWQKRARLTFIRVRRTISAVNSALQENISGVRVIQSLSREETNSRRFDQLNQANFKANLNSALVSAAMMPLVEALVAIAIALIILFGGADVLQGTLIVGTLVAFVLYIQQFFDPIRTLTMEYAQLQRAMASGSRVFELLDVSIQVPEKQASIKIPHLKGDIIFDQVNFSYEPGVEVLSDINLRVSPGETIALVGPTGAGKSTIINLIDRFYDVSGGRILIDGQDIRDIEISGYRQQLGLVLQDPFLFSGTIRENIAYGKLNATREEVEAVAHTVGAHEFIEKLEGGYEYQLQERGQNLSMGQRQLISFARALLVNPAILLLDEATANVDSYSERILQEALERLLKNRTAVIIAHRLSTIRNANRIIVLDHGHIVEQGRHDELVANGGLYSRLYEMTRAMVTGTIRQSPQD
jgi:ATP-binding cassette, subfamily B, bacterial